MQPPQTKYLHKCKLSQCPHSPAFLWQSLKLVLATIRLSGLMLPPGTRCLPSRIAILPSSKRTERRFASLTPKLFCASFAFSCLTSKQPSLSHRILKTNFEPLVDAIPKEDASNNHSRKLCAADLRQQHGQQHGQAHLWRTETETYIETLFFFWGDKKKQQQPQDWCVPKTDRL